MNLKTLNGQVEYILSTNEDSRNSDITLMILLWRRFYPTMVQNAGHIKNDGTDPSKIFVYLEHLYELPREDNIKRIRAKFQNVKHLYLPTDQKVAEGRGINEETWRKHLGYGEREVHQA